jgi:hypothetical protein
MHIEYVSDIISDEDKRKNWMEAVRVDRMEGKEFQQELGRQHCGRRIPGLSYKVREKKQKQHTG